MRMRLSIGEARRIALAAAGFDRPRPRRAVRAADVRRVIHGLGLVQLDFVNVLVPAHYLVIFSRLGAYPTSLFHRAVYGGQEFTEQWGHVASVIPTATWPLLRHRMATWPIWPIGFDVFVRDNPDYCQWVLDEIRRRGPLTAADLTAPDGVERRLKESWFGTVPRAVLEMHFARGRLAVVNRLPGFARVYELAERALPVSGDGIPADEARRRLLRIAARASGIATAADLADYFRMPVRETVPRIAELVAAGELREVEVDGWRATAYLDADARMPRRIEAAALLAPFDPLVWYRPRVKRLFDVDFRFEIFVPAEKRRWGAYVLPFVLGERIVARVDLKAHRETGTLEAGGAWVEDGVEAPDAALALAAELRLMAGWLSLESIAVGRRGNLARALAPHF